MAPSPSSPAGLASFADNAELPSSTVASPRGPPPLARPSLGAAMAAFARADLQAQSGSMLLSPARLASPSTARPSASSPTLEPMQEEVAATTRFDLKLSLKASANAWLEAKRCALEVL